MTVLIQKADHTYGHVAFCTAFHIMMQNVNKLFVTQI